MTESDPAEATHAYSSRAWRADDLRASGAHLVRVDATSAHALAGALPSVFEVPEDPEDEHRFRAEIAPALAALARGIGRRLGPAGPGIAILTGEGLSDLNDGQLQALLFGLSTSLGRPIGQNETNERVVSVVDERPVDVEAARGYRTSTKLPMHTDPTDGAALLCLEASAAGGDGLYVSASAVLDLLGETAPDLLHTFFGLWDWDLRGTQRPEADRLVTTPIFGVRHGELSCRYGSVMLREGLRLGTLRDATDEKMLDLFEDALHREELALHHRMRRGESVWLNNYRVLHGRESFQDDPATGRVRHLLRTWFWMWDRPHVPPSFLDFSVAIDRDPNNYRSTQPSGVTPAVNLR